MYNDERCDAKWVKCNALLETGGELGDCMNRGDNSPPYWKAELTSMPLTHHRCWKQNIAGTDIVH